MARKPKAPPELPGRWFKSKSGRSLSYIIQTSQKDRQGNRLYRLRSLLYDWIDSTGKVRQLTPSEKTWTEEDLRANGRILKNKPTAAQIAQAK
jgi:hypothetical protein